jgi:adenosylhomocysteine nucleosidase
MSIIRLFYCLLLLLPAAPPVLSAQTNDKSLTGILGAFEEEVEIIRQEIRNPKTLILLGTHFVTGELKGRNVVLAKSGIGKVNAAMTTTLLLVHFQPTEVIFTGIAGGVHPDLQPGDLIIAEKTAQHDIVIYSEDSFANYRIRNPFTGDLNPTFFPADEKLLRVAVRAKAHVKLDKILTHDGKRDPNIHTGIIVTGDAFVASSQKKVELRQRFQADAVEMEGGAVAQICYQRKVPCLVVRSLSNTADSDVDMDSITFYRLAAHNSARYVMQIVEELEKADSHVHLLFSFSPDPKLYAQSKYQKPPQIAIWLEQPKQKKIQTVYVTEKTARGAWGKNITRPISLPYWVSRWNRETQTQGDPSPKQPAADAVTCATPKQAQLISMGVPPDNKWNYFIEVNVSGDYNETFPEASSEGKRDKHGNGQPSIIYQGTISATPGQSSTPKLIGRTDQFDHRLGLIRDLKGITTAKDLLRSLKIYCRTKTDVGGDK